ncbi:Putative dihydroorotate dehydrogenase A (fumarate) [Seminavis robusta]|uniref:Dihydroorotate dehydrogenase A (Fumarate) n=1 Tax=Seminavis robusta TaxID=568900 RepID=A0A9N8HQK4_9STRA|nr:Putative dihydroorotate dehydrogenase A (fumarate) [Seminavis robusta]|eukprot:Sro1453_g273980.1 Putative dihydroorotate dehydrogenase A (fumarate) (391) ;mRNA; f:6545-7717
MSPSLATTVGGVPLTSCVYNASGPRSGTAAALSKVCQSRSGGVLAKSATILKQNGNPQPRTYHAGNSLASFNSEGLPNNGIDYYIAAGTIEECMASCDDDSKPYMVSISGKTLADNLEMLSRIAKAPSLSKIKAVELNLACPNVIGKPIIAYDFEQMKSILQEVSSAMKDTPLKLGIKLPPYFDGPHFQQAADILNEFDGSIAYVASINTLGNSLVIDPHSEAPVISSNQGFAGLSGQAVKYTALANVRKLRLALKDSIDVVGVGGVASGRDAFELILCGATAVQVGTCHWTEGPKCFDRICQELEELMESKGYQSIADFKGKLKDWSREGADIARAAAKKEASSQGGTGTKELKSSGSDNNTNLILALLVGLLAILLADKLSNGALLPF